MRPAKSYTDVTQDMIGRIIRLRASGYTCSKIAEEVFPFRPSTGLSKVYYLLKKEAPELIEKRYRNQDDSEIVETIVALRREKKSCATIADEIFSDLSYVPYVRLVLKRHAPELFGRGMVIKGVGGSSPQKRKTYEAWIELRKQGKTYEQIGETYGVTRERIRQVLKNLAPETTGPLYRWGSDYNRCVECEKKIVRKRKRCGPCNRLRSIYLNAVAYVDTNKEKYADVIRRRADGETWSSIGMVYFPQNTNGFSTMHRWKTYYEEKLKLVQEHLDEQDRHQPEEIYRHVG